MHAQLNKLIISVEW